MAIETIQVRKKSNHALTRSIRKAALPVFERRGWEPVNPIVSATPTPEVKKKDVEPAEVQKEVEQPTSEQETPFAPVGDEAEEQNDLREKYQALAGKAADKRWSEKRLSEEIAKLS